MFKVVEIFSSNYFLLSWLRISQSWYDIVKKPATKIYCRCWNVECFCIQQACHSNHRNLIRFWCMLGVGRKLFRWHWKKYQFYVQKYHSAHVLCIEWVLTAHQRNFMIIKQMFERKKIILNSPLFLFVLRSLVCSSKKKNIQGFVCSFSLLSMECKCNIRNSCAFVMTHRAGFICIRSLHAIELDVFWMHIYKFFKISSYAEDGEHYGLLFIARS